MQTINKEVEIHPLEPFLPGHAHLLMLGSFPPPRKRWSMDFYYPNWTNDMWRIVGWLFFQNKDYFVQEGRKAFDRERLIPFLKEKGIALFDTASAVRRLQDNASDKFLEVVTPTDIDALLAQLPACKAIVTTGEKATQTLCTLYQIEQPKVGDFTEFLYHDSPKLKGQQVVRAIRLYRMPSSSRAYPLSVEKKAEVYRSMYQDLGLL